MMMEQTGGVSSASSLGADLSFDGDLSATPPISTQGRKMSARDMAGDVWLCTSQRTTQLPFVKTVLERLTHHHGYKSHQLFYQEKLDATQAGTHWMTQWLANAQKAKKIVCFVDVAYLDSLPCLEEFNIAQQLDSGDRFVVVAMEPLDKIHSVEPNGKNGPVLSHFLQGGQCLLAWEGQRFHDADVLASELARALLGKRKSEPLRMPGHSSSQPVRQPLWSAITAVTTANYLKDVVKVDSAQAGRADGGSDGGGRSAARAVQLSSCVICCLCCLAAICCHLLLSVRHMRCTSRLLRTAP